MKSGTRHRAPSLRRLFAILLGALGVLVAALIVVATLQLRGSQSQADAENRRAESILVADSMRQSSNDLTNMVRLYVSTGEQRYRDYYKEILAIRNGTAPRPRDYDSSFWDRVLADGKASVRYGPRQSLVAQMRGADFTPAEFRALSASLAASNGLARVELEVMDRVQRRIRRGVDATYLADVSPDYARLVDDAYLAQKGVIMRAIDRFIGLVDGRTRRDVERVRNSNDTLSAVQIAILGLVVLVGLGAMAVVSRLAVRPLLRLAEATRRIAGGDYGERADVRAVAELEQVAGAFNEMADAVQSDVGARERAEQEAVAARLAAEEASRAKSTFLAAMSHEIRTPMIGVTGMLEVLQRTSLTPPQRHMVATAESSAQSLLQIIGDVLDFSKIEASKLELSPAPLDLRAIIQAAAETFRHTASAKGLLLSSCVDEGLAAAHMGDALRLRQIIANFLSNAVKFTVVGGIEIDARVIDESDEAQTVALSVTDTGVGVSAQQQRQLFGEYAQADASTAQRFGGTGLGLAICRRLAHLMGGDVTMRSAPGRGTTMLLTLPLPIADPADVEPLAAPAADQAPATRRKPTREQAQAEGSLVLVAEDHAVNRTVLRHQCDIIGFQADFAPDGEQALELYVGGGYALVLTDLNMPAMDGYELARAIRRHEAATGVARVPIVALTANVMQGEPERCREAGMDDFAAKPTTIPFLAAKLRQWLPHLDWAPEPDSPAAANGSVAPADAMIDPAVLAEVTGGDAELAETLVADFRASTRADLDALDDALAGGDLDAARRRAHRIKGAARTVGAHAIVAVAQQIETGAAGSSTIDELASLAGRLHAALADGRSPSTPLA
ncbi:MAG TPA: ATP-binding protein [Solirubrobacteraceae bacterium]|nr:ATP-binding protein [Solirubrobacteraceae bacterium]